MSEPIDFILRGKADGVEISPRTIGLSRFNDFNQEVEDFIGDLDCVNLEEATIALIDGAYVLQVLLPKALFAAMKPDPRLLERQDSLGELDGTRRCGPAVSNLKVLPR